MEGKALLPPPSCIDDSSALLRFIMQSVTKSTEKDEHEGFAVWASTLGLISSSTFEHGLSSESELKLSVLMLAKVVERLLILEIQRTDLSQTCFTSLMEASVSLKEAQGEKESGDDQDAGDKETDEEEELLPWKMGLAEEGDMEEQEQELELGKLVDSFTVKITWHVG
ncbi:hypothetical protein Acr_22g0009820 [Actinidia rufa]|uniref:Uncharacterized protein n=1 Tax=Actinidia rufa TaxID=165716 RepID=A0A7J0GLM4_9ERIC|nr:hypothetical protein Acr_22g0009820 [Actinidia rufa]